ncbi:MAG TPA: hypothetical protein VJ792_00415, partial [Candidatus Nitrosotalea sp.]|nr:hypothetical protein [Candidatus Nitrosotalea sp.]
MGSPVNWKIVRYVYDEIMLIGTKEVIEKTNELLSDNSPDSENADNIMKHLWNVMRKDLYGEEVPLKHMKTITPSPETLRTMVLHNKYFNELKSLGIDTIEKTSKMNIDDVIKHCTIDRDSLNLIKNMAQNEL